MGGLAAPIIGGAFGLLGANSAARNQRRATGAQRNIAQQQAGLFRQASPYYQPILEYLAGNAGLTPLTAPGRSPAATGTAGQPLPGGEGSLQPGALGIFQSNPADALRFRQAEEDLARSRIAREQQLRFRLGRQGAGEATTAAAIARNEQDYQTGLGQFRRAQAIQAGSEQERRIGALLAALGIGFGQGGNAAAIFGNQANLAGNQLGQSGGMLSQALSDLILARLMARRGGTPPIVDPVNSWDPSGGITGQWWGY